MRAGDGADYLSVRPARATPQCDRAVPARTSGAPAAVCGCRATRIYPPLLAEKGLAAALGSQVRKVPVPVALSADGVGRYPEEIEAAVYFCVLEALQNVAKYADAKDATLSLSVEAQHLVFSVADDGRGFDLETTPHGSGLANMLDRIDALGGTVEVQSHPGEGCRVTGRIPVTTDGVPASQTIMATGEAVAGAPDGAPRSVEPAAASI